VELLETGAVDVAALEVAGALAAVDVDAEADVAADGGEDAPLFEELLHPTRANAAAVAAVIPTVKRRAMGTAFCVPCLKVRPRVSGGH
jgi:hypothetical protein